ncbi:MAG: 4-(cytidine 5'-diphospho)-2-C-methyl-D-erythritol kinase [Proteobacteria bacterium]|nr:4-(cytidine 5'-diphospho)-2-C-methyl-D-erythritol kinase [Pseudomonadota bacterium]
MTDAWTTWPAPAKLNLFLHIVGRRADGYHRLQTMFQLLDWGDTLRLRLRDDGQILRVAPVPGIAEQDDLCLRAACALADHAEAEFGVDIALAKRVPVGGGLGGGSSDAATVLVALNVLWECGLSEDELAGIGAALGADVPVFVRGRSAWAKGVGDELTPVDLPPRWFVIVDPGVAVPTGELFRAPELTRDSAPTTIQRFLAGKEMANAFEPVVREHFPLIDAALDWLGQFGQARLSGSGGCGFLAIDSERAACDIARQCPQPFRAWTARGVNRSPLLDALEKHRKN